MNHDTLTKLQTLANDPSKDADHFERTFAKFKEEVALKPAKPGRSPEIALAFLRRVKDSAKQEKRLGT